MSLFLNSNWNGFPVLQKQAFDVNVFKQMLQTYYLHSDKVQIKNILYCIVLYCIYF